MYVCIRIIIYSIGYFMGINLRYWIYIIIDIYILLFKIYISLEISCMGINNF